MFLQGLQAKTQCQQSKVQPFHLAPALNDAVKKLAFSTHMHITSDRWQQNRHMGFHFIFDVKKLLIWDLVWQKHYKNFPSNIP